MEKLVIIGSGSGGLPVASMVAKFRKNQYDITVITKDPDIAYSPCGIPYVLKGDIPSYKDLIMHSEEHYKESGIKILTNTSVEEIDTQKKRIRYKSTWLGYNYLVIATGTAQRVPKVKGIDLNGVFSAHIKTLKEAEKFEEFILNSKKPLKVIMTGSSSIDLEFATGLKERGHDIIIVEKAAHLMPDRLDSDMAEYVNRYLHSMGIRVITMHELSEITGTEKIESVNFGDLTLPADLLMLGTDFMPEITLAKSAGFDTDKYGINIDEKARALIKGKAAEGVYASGACANAINIVTGKRDFMFTGSTSIQKSRIISEQLLSIDASIKGSTNPKIAVLRDLNIGTAGLTKEEAEKHNIEVKTCVTEEKSTARYYPGGIPVYMKLLFEKNSLRLIGAQIVSKGCGIKERIDTLSIAMNCRLTAKELAHLETAYSPPVSHILDIMVELAKSVWFENNIK
ncbi:MAG: FAD-dependent oxidoreductase [Candidatus Methanoperedens sp.]|nr:FAD-dependent oxidoreductase [Candidatus Methanoperedens sp.]CAG1001403.1 Assimilatory nitrate reductase electron transfer subunit [Methanosarcinales archaeon]